MGCTLYERDTFTNDNIFYMFNRVIHEYDMKRAGFSLICAFHLLPDKTIDKLSRMKKERQEIEIGKLQRDNPEFKENLRVSFQKARKLFFEANELDVDDIISIKKDAIFTTKTCMDNVFMDVINFREKHTYTSYIRLNKRIEMYYSDDVLDIKGLGDDCLHYHEEYMIQFIRSYFQKMETEDAETVIGFVRRFIDRYKKRDLPIGFYRRFSRDSCYYDILNSDEKYYEYWEEEKQDIDISYNYFEVLIKLIKIPL